MQPLLAWSRYLPIVTPLTHLEQYTGTVAVRHTMARHGENMVYVMDGLQEVLEVLSLTRTDWTVPLATIVVFRRSILWL